MQDIKPKDLNDFLIESARAVSNNRAKDQYSQDLTVYICEKGR
jgi:hypothetical protein